MPEPNSAKYWIQSLKMKTHPEGGYYAESYRSREEITREGLPERYPSPRSISTSIYFLLEGDDFSSFHRIRSDELWYFHDGDPVEIFMIKENGELIKTLLGRVPEASLQLVIPHNTWFAAKSTGEYSLAGCNVAPGFDFADFELATYSRLLKTYPHHREIIRRFTRE